MRFLLLHIYKFALHVHTLRTGYWCDVVEMNEPYSSLAATLFLSPPRSSMCPVARQFIPRRNTPSSQKKRRHSDNALEDDWKTPNRFTTKSACTGPLCVLVLWTSSILAVASFLESFRQLFFFSRRLWCDSQFWKFFSILCCHLHIETLSADDKHQLSARSMSALSHVPLTTPNPLCHCNGFLIYFTQSGFLHKNLMPDYPCRLHKTELIKQND